MDSKQYRDIKVFISRSLFGNVEETGKVKRFVITHLTKSGKTNGDVGFVPVDTMASADDVDTIINEIETMVNADADGIGEEQRYIIRPTFSNLSFQSSIRHIIRVKATVEASEDELEDETQSLSADTTNASIAASLMRHNENIMRMTVGQPTALLGQAQRVISRLQDSVYDLHEKLIEQSGERLKIHALMEDMLSKKAQRELAAEESKQKMELLGEGFQQLKMLAPMVVNKLAGKSVLPQASTPAELMLKEFMKTLTKEQFEGMLAPLTPVQQFPLLMMYQEFQKQEEAERAKKSAGAESEPESDNG